MPEVEEKQAGQRTIVVVWKVLRYNLVGLRTTRLTMPADGCSVKDEECWKNLFILRRSELGAMEKRVESASK